MGSKITNSEATRVAESMVAATIGKKRAEIIQLMSDLITPVMQESIPDNIKVAFKAFPKYFHTTSHIKPTYHGISEMGIQLNTPVPSDQGWGHSLEIQKPLYDKLLKLHRKQEDLRSEGVELKNNLYETLCSLRTFKKIKEQFPAAYEHIPQEWLSSENTGLAIPIEQLVQKLQEYK